VRQKRHAQCQTGSSHFGSILNSPSSTNSTDCSDIGRAVLGRAVRLYFWRLRRHVAARDEDRSRCIPNAHCRARDPERLAF